MRTRPLTSRTLTSVAVLSLVGLFGLSACGGSSQRASGAPAEDAGLAAAGPAAGSAVGNTGTKMDSAARAQSTRTTALSADLLTRPALIKTGSVDLRSDHPGRVLTRVYGIVGGVGGDVGREDTSTDVHGAVVRSSLTLRVPVDDFDTTLNNLGRLGTLVDRVRSSKDVTTDVADIDSRVRSARRSIATLRLLFHRASRLGDIIRLESELSQREADLESLQAQQRALDDRTTMSTITMTVDRSPKAVVTTTHHAATTGFGGGVRQGWHALTSTVVAVGHGIGLVLPLGTVLLVLAGAGLWLGRRFLPASGPEAKPTVDA